MVKFKVGLFVLLIGYAAAWVGHFLVEHNHPATFTYPAFSLIGDVTMWTQLISGKVTGLKETYAEILAHGLTNIIPRFKV
eukprot:UN08107